MPPDLSSDLCFFEAWAAVPQKSVAACFGLIPRLQIGQSGV